LVLAVTVGMMRFAAAGMTSRAQHCARLLVLAAWLPALARRSARVHDLAPALVRPAGVLTNGAIRALELASA
jgi:hypothetical protein